jgi:hypothetical protein
MRNTSVFSRRNNETVIGQPNTEASLRPAFYEHLFITDIEIPLYSQSSLLSVNNQINSNVEVSHLAIMSPAQPATADTGYITEPLPLENTYTSDPSLQRALSCELLCFSIFE